MLFVCFNGVTRFFKSFYRAAVPAAYYPGIEARWQNFAKEYPDAKQIDSVTGLGAKERCLSPARFAEKVQVDVES
jgi:hypothetical protein